LRHPDFIAALAHESRRQCPCGAVAEHSYGLCRKCRARVAWRRKATGTNRRTARRLAARHIRTLVQFLAFTPISKGVEH
jgi:hypothetical protein